MKDHESKRGEWSHSLSKGSVSAGTPGWPILVSRVQTSFVGRSHLNTLRPPAWESVVKQVVGESVGRNPLSRGGHTQVAGSGAFSKTGGRRGGCVLFGHRASLARLQQLQRWRVEMCIFEWCGVWIGSLTEPSAGSRRWWNPGFSRVGKVACR